MSELLIILRSLASRYKKSYIKVPKTIAFKLIHRELKKLENRIQKTSDYNFINLKSLQSRKDHNKLFNIAKLDKLKQTFFEHFQKENIYKYNWAYNEIRYIVNAIKASTAAIPYYDGEKNLKALTVYHNPELLILKYLFGKKLYCYDHGIRIKPINFSPKFPLVAGCDELNLFFKEDFDIVREIFDYFDLKCPVLNYETTYKIKKIDIKGFKRVVYLPTIYKKINPLYELILLRLKYSEIKYKLHPRLSSNFIKIFFFKVFANIFGGLEKNFIYRADTLYLSNGSSALIEAQKKGCAVAFFSPIKGIKNPYPNYMKIPEYKGKK